MGRREVNNQRTEEQGSDTLYGIIMMDNVIIRTSL